MLHEIRESSVYGQVTCLDGVAFMQQFVPNQQHLILPIMTSSRKYVMLGLGHKVNTIPLVSAVTNNQNFYLTIQNNQQ